MSWSFLPVLRHMIRRTKDTKGGLPRNNVSLHKVTYSMRDEPYSQVICRQPWLSSRGVSPPNKEALCDSPCDNGWLGSLLTQTWAVSLTVNVTEKIITIRHQNSIFFSDICRTEGDTCPSLQRPKPCWISGTQVGGHIHPVTMPRAGSDGIILRKTIASLRPSKSLTLLLLVHGRLFGEPGPILPKSNRQNDGQRDTTNGGHLDTQLGGQCHWRVRLISD